MTTTTVIVNAILHSVFGIVCLFLVPYPYNIATALGFCFAGLVAEAINLIVINSAIKSGEQAEACIKSLIEDNSILRQRNNELLAPGGEFTPLAVMTADSNVSAGE